jgi:endonuclease/exonuclease/phosphatase family metal-dependent hydrolase
MGFAGRSTIGVLAVAVVLLMHAPAVTAPLGEPAPLAAPSQSQSIAPSHPGTLAPSNDTLSCLQPVDGFTWMRWDDHDETLDLWCHSVGGPVAETRLPASSDITGMRILSWNVHVGAGRLEELLPRLLDDAAREAMGLTILLQETFRTGDEVPEFYPATIRVPKAIRPRRPAMDVRDIAARFGLSVAYVPSMRNGSAASVTEREDRGNAILSTEPLIDVRAIELPFGKQRRVAVSALIPPREGGRAQSIRVVSAHFDTNGDRVSQAAALSERLASMADVPLVVGGDLNSRNGQEDDAFLALASRFPLASCGTGRTNRWPLRLDVLFPIGRLDFMFAAMETDDIVRSCETLPHAYDSDHLPLLLTLKY